MGKLLMREKFSLLMLKLAPLCAFKTLQLADTTKRRVAICWSVRHMLWEDDETTHLNRFPVSTGVTMWILKRTMASKPRSAVSPAVVDFEKYRFIWHHVREVDPSMGR